MIEILIFLFYLSLFFYLTGTLGTVPLGLESVNIYLLDIPVTVLFFYWLWKIPQEIHRYIKDKKYLFFLIFVFWAFISLLISPISLTYYERFVAFLYLIRTIAYSSVYLTVHKLIELKKISSKKVYQLLIVFSLCMAVLGWVQYFLYPYLRNLSYLGWDPHLGRIFGTLLDPNYFGLIIVFPIIVCLSGLLPLLIALPVGMIFFFTLMFTYSRSSYIAFFISSLVLFLMKRKILIFTLLIFLMIVCAILLPRKEGAGVRLERVFSLNDRISNWQDTATIVLRYPLFGVGFNTLRYARRELGFNTPDLMSSHSGAGVDNSFLFVLVTTGLFGLIFFSLMLCQFMKEGTIIFRLILTAILIHSLFLNSFFFPWVMFWMWIILAVKSI